MLFASLAITFGTSVALGAGDASQTPLVVLATFDDEAITPVAAGYLERAVEEAEELGAECLVVTLDTPGGLVDSTREMVRTILRADVPVVVFVPAGGRAASAGVFVTLASHVAAMGPGSNIGAAHPVQIGGLPIGPPPSEPPDGGPPQTPLTPNPADEKAVQDTAAWARSLADLHGRDRDWAERAVVESLSITALEAFELGVIEVLADDVDELLVLLDGREVDVGRRRVTLRTEGARTHVVEFWWGERVLAAISNPNVAFLLLVFGFYGILFELYSPGWGVAGTLGAIALCLGFFALSVLPVSYAGLILIALGLGLFVAEAVVTSYGLLAVGGVVCLALGGLMLVDSPEGFQRVSVMVVFPVAAATAIVTVFLVGSVLRAQRGHVQTGTEGMVGERAVADAEFTLTPQGYTGTVSTHGETWKAESEKAVRGGDELEVRARAGMTLIVAAARGTRSESWKS